MAPKVFKANNKKVVSSDGNRANELVINLSKNNKFRNSMHMPDIKAIREPIFLISNIKKVFNYINISVYQSFNPLTF